MRVRAASSDDAAAIGHVHVETWRDTYAGLLPDAYLVEMSITRQAAFWAQGLTAEPSARPDVVLVLEDDNGHVVGFISGGKSRSRKALHGQRFDGEMYTLYVLPDHQGMGLGRELLQAGFEGLAARSFSSAVIWVLASNPSRFFYEAMGGEAVARRMEKFAGSEVEEVAYGWTSLELATAPKR